MTQLVVTLPWPAPLLWPNARPSHWSQRAKAVRLARAAAGQAAIKAGAHMNRAAFAGDATIGLHLIFHPGPRQRESDADNRIAASKSAIDGIAAALHVNDSRFVVTEEVGARAAAPHVIATLTAPATEALTP